MDSAERARLRGFCTGNPKSGSWPNGAMLAALDALDAADRAAERAEAEIAALRDLLAETERERDRLLGEVEMLRGVGRSEAQRKGAEAMRETILYGCPGMVLTAYQHGRIRALPLPGEEVPRG